MGGGESGGWLGVRAEVTVKAASDLAAVWLVVT